MRRRAFLQSLALPWALRAQTKRPNIVLVLADDLTYLDCEPYGSKQVRTPNMARLAKEGMCFDGMSTASAMCAPTRAQLYTGLYPIRNGAYPNHSWVYDGVKGAPVYFRDLGYRVGINGKIHFGPKASFPFETVGKAGEEIAPGEDREIKEFVERDRNQPFFFLLASHQPHTPRDKGKPEAYPPERIKVPPHLIDCPHTRAELSKYFAEITYLDEQLGTVMKVIDDAGVRDNTIFIFTSEQGTQMPFGKWTCYEIGLRTGFIARWPGRIKPGTRNKALIQYVDVLPTLIEAAGAKPPKDVDGRSFLDILEGSQRAHREYVYGVHTTRGIINGSPNYPIRSVRAGRYKLIVNLNHEAPFSNVLTSAKQDGHILAWMEWAKTHPEAKARAEFYVHRPKEEFYDLEADPFELNNLAGQAQFSSTIGKLRRELAAFMKQQGDLGIETELKANERKPKTGGPE
jgi:uncharacterized sulfatase